MRRPARNAPRRLVPARAARQPPAHTPQPLAAPRPPLSAAVAAQVSELLQAAVGGHQAGQLVEAEALYRQVLALDEEQPDALHLLGVLALQVGQPAAAVPLIERAIAHRPNAPTFRLNLGNALLALGQTEPAVAAYRRAAQLQPDSPDAHYNLGNALIQQGENAAGLVALRRAIQLRPEHADAHYNLGNALRTEGHAEEAIVAYLATIRLRPDFADAQGNLGILLHEMDRLQDARPYFERALALQPDHRAALRGLAGLEQGQGQYRAAAGLLARLAAVEPEDVRVHDHLARCWLAAGEPLTALSAVVGGLERFPEDRELRHRLVEALQDMAAPLDGRTAEIVRAGLLRAVRDDRFPIQELATPIGRLIVGAPEFPDLLAAVRQGIDPLAAGLPLPPALTDEPMVLAALPRVVFCLPEVERVLTALRRSVLLRATDPDGDRSLPLPYPFLCALAGAAFLTEYAWLVEEDEASRLDALADGLAALLADPAADLASAEGRLLLVGMYRRIGALPGADRLSVLPDACWSEPFRAVLREQVREPLSEARLAAQLPSLTPIAEGVSQAVQAMYEENPYPRWRAARFRAIEPLAVRFRALCPGEPVPAWPTPLPVLVAGAGTGQHPIQTALRLPEADVLAVDLSRTSLGYGARMAAQMAVPNLRLAHADILALGVLEGRFALIECAGVLHHLADPMAGWRVLRRLLRPDGLMSIALYSERARAGIVAARALLAEQAIPSTADGIRAARRQIVELPPEHPAARLTGFWDFYSQSGFRDLAMHVQEHRFTVPRIGACLEELGLQFLGFDVTREVRERFQARFPQPGALLDLAAWDQFEAEQPGTFSAMYQFWCRPR
ncbi:MAG: tetratricopeptide repeat protein [Chloroflexi bacterium]|nr:tetratricopeptide repeat protein [Chloroflexota bacterium]